MSAAEYSLKNPIVYTAMPDGATADRDLWRCGQCHALVLAADASDHSGWHLTLASKVRSSGLGHLVVEDFL